MQMFLDVAPKEALNIADKIMLRDKIKKRIIGMSRQFGAYNVFSEWIEICCLSISNAVDKENFEPRERRYFDLLDKYGKDNIMTFAEMFAEFTIYLEHIMATNGPKDVLGEIFHELELHNESNGQFFTPNPVSMMMGQVVVHKKLRLGELEIMNEPCVGGGAMIFGLMNAYHKEGQRWQTQTFVDATDIDIRCVHMAYLQMSLYGVQGIVTHGNTITQEKWSHWKTPMGYMNRNFINLVLGEELF